MTKQADNTLTLNGEKTRFVQGETIMEVALRSNVFVPHLCHHPDYPPQGNCKICTVNADGKTVCACTTEASADMQVETDTQQLTNYRRQLTELLFSEGNHHCPSCERAGNCQLQATAYEVEMQSTSFELKTPSRPIDSSHKDILLDRDRCIFCGLCVRASIAEGKNVFSFNGRGPNNQLNINTDSGLLSDSSLEKTDQAAQICPVGAILIRGEGFNIPIGERLYDQQGIKTVGNHRPQYTQIQPSNCDNQEKSGNE